MCETMHCDGRCTKPNRHKYTMSYQTQAQKFEALHAELQEVKMLVALLVREIAPQYAEMPDEGEHD